MNARWYKKSYLRVYPLPPQLPTNPYLDQLYRPMTEMEVSVRRLRPRYALPELLLGHDARLLHLHFFDELTQRPAQLATATRSLGFLALLATLRRRGARLVWTAHNLEPHESHRPLWSFVLYRTVAGWADAVIAHSQSARAALERRYGSVPHCHVIPQGNYIGMYGPVRDRAQSRAVLGLPEQGRVFLNFGILRPYKGIESLIGAFADLPECKRGVLLIAGAAKDPAYVAALQYAAAAVPGVRLQTTFIPDAELPGYLAAADVVVLPYQRMLTSAVLLMAMSYARPVIAPAFGPVCELVHDGQEALLFSPGEPAALRAALERALHHPGLDALGLAAYTVAQGFLWPEVAARTVEVYREVTSDE
jgi:glycosyltransferase involved in cell wall biosynthesis